MPSSSRSSSSAAHHSLEDSDVGDVKREEDEGHMHDETNTSQIPDAPEPSQQHRQFNLKPRKRREYGLNDIYTPDAYTRKASKDKVIEAAGESEEEELQHVRRRRRGVAKNKEDGKTKRGKRKN
jgi:hypothetical protein